MSKVTEQKHKSAKPKSTRFQSLRAYVLCKQALLTLADKDLRCQGRNEFWQRKEPAQSWRDQSRMLAEPLDLKNRTPVPFLGDAPLTVQEDHAPSTPETHTQVPAESVQDLWLSEDSHISHGLACINSLITLS